MAWSVDDIYKFTRFLTKTNQSGRISATDLFYAWNSEQVSYQNDILGRFNIRSNGKSGANTGLILNETIKQELAAFTLPLPITIAAGKADKPTDFIYEVGLRKGNYDIVKINHDQISTVQRSVIDPPSTTDNKYYAVEYDDYYYLLPQSVTGTVDLDYIASCTDIVWGFTLDVNNRQVYSAGASVQPKWNQNTIVTITKRALKVLGVHFLEQNFEQYGNSVINTGN